ncbi:MAG TPA: hypothetical protein PLS80_11965 [Cyclobacteriaceae bacterium]|nr:hypothetical protein [Cyclobacteriaceae bacterium]HNH60738.1 hypothetical protein [Cyclobacteriaceae bacterium]
MMKTATYKKGVQEIVSRAQEINPQIGSYQDHKPSGPDHFQITLSNGTLILPRLVAQNQQEFPEQVSREWVAEIANTFAKGAAEARQPSALERLFGRFKSK